MLRVVQSSGRTEISTPMTGSPTIKGGKVFATSNNNEIFALDLATGNVLWSDQAIAETARVLGSPSPAAVEDLVVAPFSSGEVIAYLASNGRRLWTDALSRAGVLRQSPRLMTCLRVLFCQPVSCLRSANRVY